MQKMLISGFISLLCFSSVCVASNDTLSDLVARQSQMEEELRELRGRLEEMEYAAKNSVQSQTEAHKITSPSSHPVDKSQPLSLYDKTRANDALDESLEDDGSRLLEDPDEGGSVQAQYNRARDLVMQRKYAEASDMFKSLIQRNASDPIVVDAHYWIGEINFIQGQFEEAAISYADSYQSFKKLQGLKKAPAESKAPNALIQLARSFRKLGQVEKSKEILAQYKKIFAEKQSKSLEKQYERAQREISPQVKTPTKIAEKA